jgi:hypothetical protein
MRKKVLFLGMFIALFFILNLQEIFSQQDGYNCLNPIDTVDNNRPVRLSILYLENTRFLMSENPDILATEEQIRDRIISQVGYLNEIVFNSKLSTDDDPQRFEIARIYRWPQDQYFHQNENHQQYLYCGDLFLNINLDLATNSGNVPACPYQIYPPLETRDELLVWWKGMNNYNYSLAHEVGHAMGCGHEIGNAVIQDRSSQNPPVCHNFGYWFLYGTEMVGGVSKDCLYGTIMSYHGVNSYNTNHIAKGRIPYFSNPDVSWNGIDIGTGPSNCNVKSCDNAKAISETKFQLRNMCTSYVDLNLSEKDPNISTNEIMAWEIADAFAISTVISDDNYIIHENAIVQFRAGNRIIIRSGFHAKSGCKFKAFINDGTTRGFYGN